MGNPPIPITCAWCRREFTTTVRRRGVRCTCGVTTYVRADGSTATPVPAAPTPAQPRAAIAAAVPAPREPAAASEPGAVAPALTGGVEDQADDVMGDDVGDVTGDAQGDVDATPPQPAGRRRWWPGRSASCAASPYEHLGY